MADNTDYIDEILSDVDDVVDSLNMGINELQDLNATLVNLNNLNLCRDNDKLAGVLANMNPNAPTTIEGIEEALKNPKFTDALDPNIGDKLMDKINDYLNGDMNETDIDISDLFNGNNGDNGNNETDNYAIIEFGDDYINGEAIKYRLNVKPGETINNDTIIAYIKDGNNWKPVRSIFADGKIMDVELTDGNIDYYHLYSDKAQRHIIVHPYTLGTGTDLSQGLINNIVNDVQLAGYRYAILKDHLIYSILPLILYHMETEDNHKQYHTFPVPIELLPDPIGKYDDIIDKFNKLQEKYGKIISAICTSDNIKATGGKKDEMSKLKDKIFDVRDEMLAEIIGYYDDVRNERANTYRYIPEFLAGLNAHSTSIKSDYEKIADNDGYKFYNYYNWLISMLDLSDENNTVIQEYYDLLSGIVQNRAKYEAASKYSYIDELNKLFSTIALQAWLKTAPGNITSPEKLKIKDAFYEYLNNKHGNNASYSDVLQTTYELLGIIPPSIDDLGKSEDEKVNMDVDEKTVKSVPQLVSLYMFISSLPDIDDYSPEQVKAIAEQFSEEDLRKLIKDEYNKLTSFWNKIIIEYSNMTMKDAINNVTKKTQDLTAELEWPLSQEMTIDGITYKHYLFKNPLHIEKSATDGVDGAETYNEVETADYKALQEQEPVLPSDDEAKDLLDNNSGVDDEDGDISDDEPTVYDLEYWVKYYSLATIVTLPFLASGFDIPPAMIPVPMPCIYICINVLPLKELNLCFVFGLAIRGIYIYPIIQCVNTSSQPASPLTPIVAILNKIRDIYMSYVQEIENFIPNYVGIILQKLYDENSKYIANVQKLEAQFSSLMRQSIEGQAQIKNDIECLAHPDADGRINIFRNEILNKWNGVKQVLGLNKEDEEEDTDDPDNMDEHVDKASEEPNEDSDESSENNEPDNDEPNIESKPETVADTTSDKVGIELLNELMSQGVIKNDGYNPDVSDPTCKQLNEQIRALQQQGSYNYESDITADLLEEYYNLDDEYSKISTAYNQASTEYKNNPTDDNLKKMNDLKNKKTDLEKKMRTIAEEIRYRDNSDHDPTEYNNKLSQLQKQLAVARDKAMCAHYNVPYK